MLQDENHSFHKWKSGGFFFYYLVISELLKLK